MESHQTMISSYGVDGTCTVLNDIKLKRDDMFAGGYAVRQFVEMTKQARCFFVNHHLVYIDSHEQSDDMFSDDDIGAISDVANNIRQFDSNLYVVDVIYLPHDDRWIVVECDDSQVVELMSESYEKFYSVLAQ